MVLTDYSRRSAEENSSTDSIHVQIEESADFERPSVSVLEESRTKYGTSFANASEGKCRNAKKSHHLFANDRLKKSKPPRMIGDMIVTPMNYLTNRQRKRIVDTWKSIADRRQLGQRIYMQVFMHKPSLKIAPVMKCPNLKRWICLVTQSLFSFRDVPIDQLYENMHFDRQSAMFADFLHTIVGYVQLDSENLLRDLCHRLGVRHAQFTNIDFAPDWWRLFVHATLDCLQPYFPPVRHNTSHGRFGSRNVMAQLPFVGQWLRDAYKQAWSILLQHAVQLMSEAFANYRTKPCSGYYERASESYLDTHRFGIHNPCMDMDERYSRDHDEYDDQVELQLIIVTTPVDELHDQQTDLDLTQFDQTQCIDDYDRDTYSVGEMRDAKMDSDIFIPTSYSLQQPPIMPRSWEPIRKRVLRLNSLEDWDLQDID